MWRDREDTRSRTEADASQWAQWLANDHDSDHYTPDSDDEREDHR